MAQNFTIKRPQLNYILSKYSFQTRKWNEQDLRRSLITQKTQINTS